MNDDSNNVRFPGVRFIYTLPYLAIIKIGPCSAQLTIKRCGPQIGILHPQNEHYCHLIVLLK